MIGKFFIFALGAGVGGAAVAYHKWAVQVAISKERRENSRLQKQLNQEIMRNAQTAAYSNGFDAGVSCPVANAERMSHAYAARRERINAEKREED